VRTGLKLLVYEALSYKRSPASHCQFKDISTLALNEAVKEAVQEAVGQAPKSLHLRRVAHM
jgi:hypothetical protein